MTYWFNNAIIQTVQNIEQKRRKEQIRKAFNYSKLRGRIIEKYGSQTDFAKAFGCSDRTLSLKMTGKRPWKQVEILKAIKLLDLSEDDIQDYFFALEVQKI